MKKEISWTDKQREIAELAGQGKTFTDIIGMGYSKHMTSRVLTALKEGKKPEPKGGGTAGGSEPRELVGTAAPKTSPIIFRLATKEITLDPLELHRQFSYYEDLAKKNGGLGYTFSEVLTMGMQLIWIMKQDIPITENMLRALFYGYK